MGQHSSQDGSGRLLAEVRPGDNAQPLSVSELSGALKRVVEDRFGQVRVRGEISGWKRAGSGHCYFALKDESALIDAVMWKGMAGRMNFAAEDGLDVIATGKLTTYPGRSKYQIVVDRLELAGEGALMQLFERLKARLQAEGLFNAQDKRPLPYLPRTIGIVTSPTGSVIRDMLHRIADRFPVHVLLWPVRVQGDGAAAEIAAAVDGFSAMPDHGPIPRPDLVIVARGGGSIEDLWAFNEEAVVRAVAGCSIPVISAVGHETDTTLCDHAADMRAPTPTAAAEYAVPVRDELIGHIQGQSLRLSNALRRNLSLANERLAVQIRLMPAAAELIGQPQQRVDELGERLKQGLVGRLSMAAHQLSEAAGALRKPLLDNLVARKQDRLNATRLKPQILARRWDSDALKLTQIGRLMESLHPDLPLRRGFARVTDRNGHTLTNGMAARDAAALTLKFADQSVDVTVDGGTVGGGTVGGGTGSSARLKRKAGPDTANPARPTTQGNLFS